MTYDHLGYQRSVRRRQGIGPKARMDAALDVRSLMRAGGFETPTALGNEVGLSGSSLQIALNKGFTIWTADRLAARLKLHPYDVWGERWYEAGERYEAQDDLQETG